MMEKIEWYQEVLELEPSSKVFFPLAKLLQSNNQPEEAIATLQQGLDRHPEFFEARLMLIDLLDSSGRKEEASQQVERLSSKLGLYPGFWQAWAGICERQGHADISLALRLTAVFLSGRGITLMDILQSGLNSVLGDNSCSARPQPASGQSDTAENPYPASIMSEATQTLSAEEQEAEPPESSPDPIIVQIEEDNAGQAEHMGIPEIEAEGVGLEAEKAEPLPVGIAVDPEVPAPAPELFGTAEAPVAPEFSDMELIASAEQSVAVSVETSVEEPAFVLTEELAAVAVKEIETTENTDPALLESLDTAALSDTHSPEGVSLAMEVSEAEEQLPAEQTAEQALPAGLATSDPVSVDSGLLPEPVPLPPPPEPAAKEAQVAQLAQGDEVIHALVAESPELEHDEEPFSLRTKTMAGLLVEQGDLQGALEIYEELLAAAASPEAQAELQSRVSDLKRKIKGVEPTSAKTDEKEEPLQGKEKLLDALESLARRLEARAEDS